ncbi:hypothetical protein BDY21DRAFT_349880 [Lineolata rhizophorae]|uniref:Uncharacterized protein n=1 Tax=Lineolata rhizophorae TaxID=578093 RepID=A0A6A6NV67_9PEZI|nr:hypothetical protein BDY21DRAFT_349880 [Lineolata rhizophorae]
MRALLGETDGDERYYWAPPARWEILYIGHCGDFFEPWRYGSLAHRTWPDDTLPGLARMHPTTAAYLRAWGVPDQTRMVHRSYWPLCTFAYGVSRASARRIVDDLAPREPDQGCMAWDVRILEACRDDGWLCYSANPELFHHTEEPSEIGRVDLGDHDDHRRLAHGTPNIACGARSKSFVTEDPDTLAYLRDAVGERGECLVDHMEEDMRRWP